MIEDDEVLSQDEATQRYMARREQDRLGITRGRSAPVGHISVPADLDPADPYYGDLMPTQRISRKAGTYFFRGQAQNSAQVRDAATGVTRGNILANRMPKMPLGNPSMVQASITVHNAIRAVKTDLSHHTLAQMKALQSVSDPDSRRVQQEALAASLEARLAALDGISLRQQVRSQVGNVTVAGAAGTMARAKLLVVKALESQFGTSPLVGPPGSSPKWNPIQAQYDPMKIGKVTVASSSPARAPYSGPRTTGFTPGLDRVPQVTTSVRTGQSPFFRLRVTSDAGLTARKPSRGPIFGNNPDQNPLFARHFGDANRQPSLALSRDDREVWGRMAAEQDQILNDPRTTPQQKQDAQRRKDALRDRYRASGTPPARMDPAAVAARLETERLRLQDADRLVTGQGIYQTAERSYDARVTGAFQTLGLSGILDEYGEVVPQTKAQAELIQKARDYTDQFLRGHRLNSFNPAHYAAMKQLNDPTSTPAERLDAQKRIDDALKRGEQSYSGRVGRLFGQSEGYRKSTGPDYTGSQFALAREQAAEDYVTGLSKILPMMDISNQLMPLSPTMSSIGAGRVNDVAMAQGDLDDQFLNRRQAAMTALGYIRQMGGFYQPGDELDITGSGGYDRPTEDRALANVMNGAPVQVKRLEEIYVAWRRGALTDSQKSALEEQLRANGLIDPNLTLTRDGSPARVEMTLKQLDAAIRREEQQKAGEVFLRRKATLDAQKASGAITRDQHRRELRASAERIKDGIQSNVAERFGEALSGKYQPTMAGAFDLDEGSGMDRFDEANWAGDMIQNRGSESDWAMISNYPGAGQTGNQKDVSEKSRHQWRNEQVGFALEVNSQQHLVATQVVPQLYAQATAARERGDRAEANRLEHLAAGALQAIEARPIMDGSGASAYNLPFHSSFESGFYSADLSTSGTNLGQNRSGMSAEEQKAEIKIQQAILKEINDENRQRSRHAEQMLLAEDHLYTSALGFQGKERSAERVADKRRIAPQTSAYEYGVTGTGTVGGLYGRLRSGIKNELGEGFLDMLDSDYISPGGLRMPFNPLLATLRPQIAGGTFGSQELSNRLMMSTQHGAMESSLDALADSRGMSGRLAMSPGELIEIGRDRTRHFSRAEDDPNNERARWLAGDPKALFAHLFEGEIGEIGRLSRSRYNQRAPRQAHLRNVDRLYAGIERQMGRPLTTKDFFHPDEVLDYNAPVWDTRDYFPQDSILRGAFRLGRKALSRLPKQKQWNDKTQDYEIDWQTTYSIEEARGAFKLAQTMTVGKGEDATPGFNARIKNAVGEERSALFQAKQEQLAMRGRLNRIGSVSFDIAEWLHDAQMGGVGQSNEPLGLLREDTLGTMERETALAMHREMRKSLFMHTTLDEAAPGLAAYLGGRSDGIALDPMARLLAAPANGPPSASGGSGDVRRLARVNQLQMSAVLNAAWETLMGSSAKDYRFPFIDPETKKVDGYSPTGTLAQHEIGLSDWQRVNSTLYGEGAKVLPAVWGQIGGQATGGIMGGTGFGIKGIETAEQAKRLETLVARLSQTYNSPRVQFRATDLAEMADLLNLGIEAPWLTETKDGAHDLAARLKADEHGMVAAKMGDTEHGVLRGSHRQEKRSTVLPGGRVKNYLASELIPYSRDQLGTMYDTIFDVNSPDSFLGQLVRKNAVAKHAGGWKNQKRLMLGDEQARLDRLGARGGGLARARERLASVKAARKKAPADGLLASLGHDDPAFPLGAEAILEYARGELDRLGLPDVRLDVQERLPGGIQGRFDPDRNVIALRSMRRADDETSAWRDLRATLHHEAVHAFSASGMLDRDDLEAMGTHARLTTVETPRGKKSLADWITGAYRAFYAGAGLTDEATIQPMLREELAAGTYGSWVESGGYDRLKTRSNAIFHALFGGALAGTETGAVQPGMAMAQIDLTDPAVAALIARHQATTLSGAAVGQHLGSELSTMIAADEAAAMPTQPGIVRYEALPSPESTVSADSRWALDLYHKALGRPYADTTGNSYRPHTIAERGAYDPSRAHGDRFLDNKDKPWDTDQLQGINLGVVPGGASPVLVAGAGSGKTAVELAQVLKALSEGIAPERAPILASFAVATAEHTEKKLREALGDKRNTLYKRLMRAHGVTTLHALGLVATRQLGVTNVYGHSGDDLEGYHLQDGTFVTGGQQDVLSKDFGGLAERDVLNRFGDLVEFGPDGELGIRQGLAFDKLKQADYPQVVETMREALHELLTDDNAYGATHQAIADYVEEIADDRPNQPGVIPRMEDGSIRRGRGAVNDRERTKIGLEAGMSDREKLLFKRMEWLQGLGLPSDKLLALLDPHSPNALRKPGSATVGDPLDWLATLVNQRVEQILQRGALALDEETGEHGLVRYYRPSDMIGKPLAYMSEAGFSPDELGSLQGRRIIMSEGQDTSPLESRFAETLAGGAHNVMYSGDPAQDIHKLKPNGHFLFNQKELAAASANALVRMHTVHRHSQGMIEGLNLLDQNVLAYDKNGQATRLVPPDPELKAGPNTPAGGHAIVMTVGANDLGAGFRDRRQSGGERAQYRAVGESIRHMTGLGLSGNLPQNEADFVRNLDPSGAMAGQLRGDDFVALVRANVDVGVATREFRNKGLNAVASFAQSKLNEWQDLSRLAEYAGIDDLALDQLGDITDPLALHKLLNPNGNSAHADRIDEFIENILDPSAAKVGGFHGQQGIPNFKALARALRTARENLALPHFGDGNDHKGTDVVTVSTIHNFKGKERNKVFVMNATESSFPTLGVTEEEARDNYVLFRQAVGRGQQAIITAAEPTATQMDAHGRSTGQGAKGMELTPFAQRLRQFGETGTMDPIVIGATPQQTVAQGPRSVPMLATPTRAAVAGPPVRWRKASDAGRINTAMRSFDDMMKDWESHRTKGTAFAEGGIVDPLTMPGDHALIAEAGPEYLVTGDRSILLDEPTIVPKSALRGRTVQVIPAAKAQARGSEAMARLHMGLGIHPAFAGGTPDMLNGAGLIMRMDTSHPDYATRIAEAHALLQATGADVGSEASTGIITAQNVTKDRLAYTRDAAMAITRSPHFAGAFAGDTGVADVGGIPVQRINDVAGNPSMVSGFDAGGNPARNLIQNLDHMAERMKYATKGLDLLTDATGAATKVQEAIAKGEFQPGTGGLMTTSIMPDISHMTVASGDAYRHPLTRGSGASTEYFDPHTQGWSGTAPSGPMTTFAPGMPGQGPTAGPPIPTSPRVKANPRSVPPANDPGAPASVTGRPGGRQASLLQEMIHWGIPWNVSSQMQESGQWLEQAVQMRGDYGQARNRTAQVAGLIGPDWETTGTGTDLLNLDLYKKNEDTYRRQGYNPAEVMTILGAGISGTGQQGAPLTERLVKANERLADLTEQGIKGKELDDAKAEQKTAQQDAMAQQAAHFTQLGKAGELNGMAPDAFVQMVKSTGVQAGVKMGDQSQAYQNQIGGQLIAASQNSPLSLAEFTDVYKYIGNTLTPQLGSDKIGGGQFDLGGMQAGLTPAEQVDAVAAAKTNALITYMTQSGISEEQGGRAVNSFIQQARDPNTRQSLAYAQATGAMDRNFNIKDVSGVRVNAINPDGSYTASQATWDPGLVNLSQQMVGGRYDILAQQNQQAGMRVEMGLTGKNDATYQMGDRTYRGQMAINAESIDIQGKEIRFNQENLGKLLGLSQVAVGSSATLQRAEFAENARQIQFQASPEVTAERRAAFDAQQRQQVGELDRQQRSVSLGRWYEDALYGTPGSNQGYDAYVQASKNQALAGGGSQLSQLAAGPAGGGAIGLENQAAFRSIEHQRAMLVFGQSSLNAGAAYEENLRYLDFQQGYTEERNDLDAKRRTGERSIQDEGLADALDVLQKSQAYARTMFEEGERHLQVQVDLLPKQNQAMEDNIALQQESLKLQEDHLAIDRMNVDVQAKQNELDEAKLPSQDNDQMIAWNRLSEMLPLIIAGYNAAQANASASGFAADTAGKPMDPGTTGFYQAIGEYMQDASPDEQKRVTRMLSDSIQSDPALQPFLDMFERDADGNILWDTMTQDNINKGGAAVGGSSGVHAGDDTTNRADKTTTRGEQIMTETGSLAEPGQDATYDASVYAGQEVDAGKGQILGPIGEFSDDILNAILIAQLAKSRGGPKPSANPKVRGKLSMPKSKAGKVGLAVGLAAVAYGTYSHFFGGSADAAELPQQDQSQQGLGAQYNDLIAQGYSQDEAIQLLSMMPAGPIGVPVGGGGMPAGPSTGQRAAGAAMTIGSYAATGAAFGPWGAAVGAGVGAGMAIYQNWDVIGPKVHELGDAIGDKIGGIFDAITDINWDGVKDKAIVAFEVLFPAFGIIKETWDHREQIAEAAQGTWDAVTGAFGSATGWLGEHGEDVLDGTMGLSGALVGKITGAKDAFVAEMEKRWEEVTGAGGALVDWIAGLPGAVISGAGDLMAKAASLQNTVLNGIIVDPFNALLGAISGLEIPLKVKGVGVTVPIPDIPQIPRFARGTDHAPEGWAWVGEEGPELHYLNRGDKVINHAESLRWTRMAYEGMLPDKRNGRDSMPGVVQLDPVGSRSLTQSGTGARVEIGTILVKVEGGSIDEATKRSLITELGTSLIKDLNRMLDDRGL